MAFQVKRPGEIIAGRIIISTNGINQIGFLLYSIRVRGSHRLELSIIIAISDNTPGVSGSNKCEPALFTNICAVNNIVTLMKILCKFLRDLATPHPTNTMNIGAARPPKPATKKANIPVVEVCSGCHVAAA